jgi:cytochrome c peroxidase
MHNGIFKTLGEVVDFYNRGNPATTDLKPLALTQKEKSALVEFLETLSGDPLLIEEPDLPSFQPRQFGKN